MGWSFVPIGDKRCEAPAVWLEIAIGSANERCMAVLVFMAKSVSRGRWVLLETPVLRGGVGARRSAILPAGARPVLKLASGVSGTCLREIDSGEGLCSTSEDSRLWDSCNEGDLRKGSP